MENNFQQQQATPEQQQVVPEQQQQAMQQQMTQQQPTQTIDVNAIAQQLSQSLDQRFNDFENKIAEQQAAQQQQMTPEQIEEMNFRLKEQFETNPQEFINNITRQAEENAYNRVRSEYQPMYEEMQDRNNRLMWEQNMRSFMANNPQAYEYLDDINQAIEENPSLLNTNDPLKLAYSMVVGNRMMGNNGDVVNNMLNNEQYRNQILGNEQLRNAIIQNYQQGLNTQQQQNGLPPLMGNNMTNSEIPASNGARPQSLKEAEQAAIRMFQENRYQ